jgi:hypothetical protein
LKRTATCVAVLLATAPWATHAQSVAWQGYLDLRIVAPAGSRDWSNGGLGKTRFGDGDGDGEVAPGAALSTAFQLTPELLASAEVQLQPQQRKDFDLLEGWLRYRPASTTPWRWSLRAGVFFPPVSLENDGPGWTSRWTLSPSAINSWVGEELRATGTELRVEHRADSGTWSAVLSAFGRNDPAGDLLASRGWALGDLTSGASAQLREPDVYGPVAHAPVPVLFHPFREIDQRIGWYGGIDHEGASGSRWTLLRYDNRGDPRRYAWQDGRKVFAWHTRFWSMGTRMRLAGVEWLAQGMHGSTAFEPQPGRYLDTRMDAGYVLAGWDHGDWQPALRFDLFRLRQEPASLPAPLSEHGNAFTAALNWRPREGWRFTGELLRVDSTRNQRMLEGHAPREVDVQAQLSVRYYF